MRSYVAATAGWISLAFLGLCALAPQAGAQDLTIASTNTGTLQLGQTNAHYLLRVTNVGAAPTFGFVSVTDIAPSGLAVTSMVGDGWTCTLSSCGRSDALAAGASYPAILLVATVAPSAGPSLTNQATVTGGGDTNAANNTASNVTPVAANGHPIAWGLNLLGQSTVPAGLSSVVAVAGGYQHGIALNKDGTATAWGDNALGETNVPAGLTAVVAIAAGGNHSLALKSDGTVVGWGGNSFGQAAVPAGLSNVVAITAGYQHSLALKSDGIVVGWGDNSLGETAVPAGLSGVVAIAAGGMHSLALKSDGSVIAWGDDGFGQSTVPAGLSGVVAIAAGYKHSIALKNDGTVMAWGDDVFNQTTVPANLSGVVAIAAGFLDSLALKSDGTVIAWGDNLYGETTAPAGLSSVVAISAGGWHSLALLSVAPTTIPVITITLSQPYGPIVDGTSYFGGSVLVNWTPGSSHTIGTISPVAIDANSQYVFTSWSDGGAITHTVAPTTATTYTANFKIQYLLTTNANPIAGGTVSPAAGFQDIGSTIQVTATANPGYAFTGFSGALSGTVNPQNLTFSGATTVTANFTLVAGSAGLRFIPVTPCRVLDTRNPAAPFGGPAITAGTSRDFVIPNSTCNIPATAQAYSLNATVVPTGPLGYLKLWPTGQALPVASTLNSLDGRIKANAAIVPAGSGGAVSIYASGTTQVVLDIDGYFVPASDTTALAFYPLTPCRIADTRLALGTFGGPSIAAGTSRTLPILSSSCGVPASAQAYSLNFTAVPSGPLGYLITWPTGQARPLVSTLNSLTGAITANAAIVPAGPSGAIDVYASSDTNLVVDINGYFAPAGAGGLSLYNLPPCRVIDSRNPPGSPVLSAGVAVDVNLTNSGCAVPAAAQAYVLNATVVPPGSLGYLTLWPQSQTRPKVSTLNALDGAITSNMAVVPTTNGIISAFPSSPTHLVLDISGYFAP